MFSAKLMALIQGDTVARTVGIFPKMLPIAGATLVANEETALPMLLTALEMTLPTELTQLEMTLPKLDKKPMTFSP
jgi:hypothetical protein